MLFRLGWDVTLWRKASDHVVPARLDDEHGALIASWSAGIDGVGWLDEACAAGEAVLLAGSGYPTVFTVTAAELSGVIAGAAPPGSRGRFSWHGEVAAQVSPDEWLILTAFDTS